MATSDGDGDGDGERPDWFFQRIERPWLTIVFVVVTGLVCLYLSGDDVMREFVSSLFGTHG